MADLMQTGAAWLASQLKANASQQVTYRRGATSVILSATVGRTLLKFSDEFGGVKVQWTDRDYILAAADLILAAAVVLPEKGDQVVDADGAVNNVYEVLPYGNEPLYRPSDQFGVMLRIHTKMVGTA